MRVRVDVCIGEAGVISLDTSFLEMRKKWLPNTGIYLEFIVKGVYNKQIDFGIRPVGKGLDVTRHAWNRFFLNVKSSDEVTFSVDVDGSSPFQKVLNFSVEPISVPLLFSYPQLLTWSVSDIRYFSNRISENMVNGTRFSLFTNSTLDILTRRKLPVDIGFWKFHELILSILTERGLNVLVTPFDGSTLYTPFMLRQLKELLFVYAERFSKFNVTWDVSGGFRKKELVSVIDSLTVRYGKDVRLAVAPSLCGKLGGEGFGVVVVDMHSDEQFSTNHRGIKIARIKDRSSSFYTVREFARKAAEAGWGAEFVWRRDVQRGRFVQYSLSKALYQGFLDSKSHAN